MEAQRLAYDIAGASEAAGWSVRKTYQLISDGKLRVRKLGTRSVIAAEDLVRLIRSLPEGVTPELAPHRRKRAKRS